MARNLQKGQFVCIWPEGSIGMIMKIDAKRAGVMFVQNGPMFSYDKIKLIPATRAQIEDAGLEGVGCVDPPE